MVKKKKDGTERRAKIALVQKAVLYSLAAAGGLAMALVAPNALHVLEQFGWIKTRRNPRDTINKSVDRLTHSGLVTRDKNGFVQLTKKGEKRLFEIERANYQFKKPTRWDKKWRLVSFDIKEKRKETRNLLRQTLTSVGFVRLHHSLWVCPYECQDLITLLKADYQIGKDILYLVSDYIENDERLRKHFDLQ